MPFWLIHTNSRQDFTHHVKILVRVSLNTQANGVTFITVFLIYRPKCIVSFGWAKWTHDPTWYWLHYKLSLIARSYSTLLSMNISGFARCPIAKVADREVPDQVWIIQIGDLLINVPPSSMLISILPLVSDYLLMNRSYSYGGLSLACGLSCKLD